MIYRYLESGHIEANGFLTEDKDLLQTWLEQFQKLLLHPFHIIHKWKVTTNKLLNEQFKLSNFSLHQCELDILLMAVTVS